ncbi:hypothetical protein HN031_10645 [Nocardioides sp. zg-1308]|uniref:Uncharacterized protein n=1 Tax=Nocardioides renjunii TaxID=3095075 RepID=A0ABU5KE51_9ACTN|nr:MULTISPECIES: hypothetical protein [unclassified Nocardioides]MDZ5663097.1 hypothetical protein [Nocardioides sp. S-58]NPD05137.1 hypothetical protein [Nocardioides sp. zg-1308]WQQ23026.1 hypothetical protein SHK17_03415 [Nocardioides sp. S-34]
MPPAKLAAAAALLGGLLWVVRALLGGGSDPLAGTLFLIGLALLLVGAAVFGTTLVRSDAVAMRVTVGLAAGLLALSLTEAFRPADTPWYDGGWGVLAVLLGGLGLVRGRRGASGRPGAGAHSR